MADTVDTAFVPAFQNVIVGLYAEDPDQLQSTVRLRTGVVGKTDHWERLGGVKLVPVTSRHQTTPHTEMVHSRRRAQMADRAGSELLDQLDEVKMMIDPRNEYTQNLVRAYRVFIAETLVDSLNAAAAEVLPAGSTVDLAGESRELKESGSALYFAFALALIFVFMVLAAQFESLLHPFTVMLAVPLAVTGALAALWLAGSTLNVYSQVGMILLIGLVTKNSILLVTYAKDLRERGRDPTAAMVEAGRIRLRPILMTSVATIMGALPIALGLGAGAGSR